MKQKAVLPTRRCLIDLHLHLDGSLSLSTVRRLARDAEVALPDDDAVLLQRLSVAPDCRNLNEYLEKFAFPLTLLQTADALTIAVSRLMEELYEQGLIYAEIRFAPQLHCAKGLTQTEVVDAAVKGLDHLVAAPAAADIQAVFRGGDDVGIVLAGVERFDLDAVCGTIRNFANLYGSFCKSFFCTGHKFVPIKHFAVLLYKFISKIFLFLHGIFCSIFRKEAYKVCLPK